MKSSPKNLSNILLFFATLLTTNGSIVLYEDFEVSNLSKKWTAIGDHTSAKRQKDNNGSYLAVSAKRGGVLASRSDIPPINYTSIEALHLRCRIQSASEENPVSFEFRIYSDSRKGARFWRKVTVSTNQWTNIELPLSRFRSSKQFFVDWSEVKRFGFFFSTETTIHLDDIEIVTQNESTPGPLMDAIELKGIAFSPLQQNVRIEENSNFTIITDAPVATEEVFVELERLRNLLNATFPPDDTIIARKPPLLIFSTEKSYKDFWPRLGAAFGGKMNPPNSQGFSTLGFAGTWYDPAQGSVRPVTMHEVAHAMLAPRFGVSNKGEWLHEGVASYFQLNWIDQNLFKLLERKIKNRTLVPLETLCNGEAIGVKNYAQAALLIQWLLEDSERKSQFQNALRSFKQTGNTALAPICEETFGRTIEVLEDQWLEWMEAELSQISQ